MKIKETYLKNGLIVIITIFVAICISVVCRGDKALPVELLYDDWKYICFCFSLSLPILALLIFFFPQIMKTILPVVLSWVLIAYGGIVSVWGICQMYSNINMCCSIHMLTGSFYNSGPYSGYIAMILPISLFECIKKRKKKVSISYSASLSVTLLIIFVLPFGMSRSAWISAFLSSAYVLLMYYRTSIKEYVRNNHKKRASYIVIGIVVCSLLLCGIYQLKKNSSDGRFLKWKISIETIAQNPWKGYGWNGVAAAYGRIQENYFATDNYTPTEKLISDAPEYILNEYLQVAIAWGIPALCMLLIILILCLYALHKKRLYGLFGSLLSLSVFSLFAYPSQFPSFISVLFLLILVCFTQMRIMERIWSRLLLVHLLFIFSYVFYLGYVRNKSVAEASGMWNNSHVLCQWGAYNKTIEKKLKYRTG